jgi:hypothetical protein
MASGTIVSQASLAGVSFSATTTRTADIPVAYAPDTPLAAAGVGQLTTRTDANTGVLTMTAGHGIVTGKVDVYWAAGIRYGMDAVVTVNSIAIDGGASDDLPNNLTAVTVGQQVSVDLPDFDGDLLEMLAVKLQRRGHVQFQEAAAVNALAREQAANEVYAWAADAGVTNPLSGKVVVLVVVSNGDSAGTSDVKIGMLLNSA